MLVFRRIVFVAALAGLISGVFVTALHMLGTARLIHRAEVYEKAADQAGTAPTATAAMPEMSHEENAWEPADGWQRTGFTVLADVLTGVGFALLLVSAYVIHGGAVDWRKGLYWGLAGFATFTLAPGLGLPPEVPGTASAPLMDRQLWWVATAVATGGGLALVLLGRKAIWVAAGVVLLVLPHLYGAPQPAEYKSAAPESLAHQFVVTAALTGFLFWAALGSLTGLIYDRCAKRF